MADRLVLTPTSPAVSEAVVDRWPRPERLLGAACACGGTIGVLPREHGQTRILCLTCRRVFVDNDLRPWVEAGRPYIL